ncbi:hypothetical protein C0993_004256 [Termitomyces sp. T159_Od127]|nr:hypothetical protein C0993_004256 [Termitomyces sp. T159_Od127]
MFRTHEPAPEIAIDYWRLPPDAKLLDVLYAVRSDETTHRFVNHSLANLNPSTDVNPFALREPDMHVKGRKTAFDRDEAELYVKESHELMEKSYLAQEDHLPSSIAVSSADEHALHHHDNRRRVFVGPMPEKVIKQAEQGVSRSNSRGDEHQDEISEVIKRNAFSFFIRQGGRPEDWGEDEERNVVEEMFRRWRDSEWAHIWRRRRDKVVAQTSRWVGNSFEVGQFLGVNILKETEATRERISMASSSVRKAPLHHTRTSRDLPRASSSIGHATYVTARTSLYFDATSDEHEHGDFFDGGHSLYGDASSSTSLLRPSQDSFWGSKARTAQMPRLGRVDTRSARFQSDDSVPAGRNLKGKGKLVHYVEPVLEEEPALPQEVLGRTDPESLIGTSAETALDASGSPSSASLNWGDTIMRDMYDRRQLGHTLPATLHVRNPRVNSSVKIDIPLEDTEQLYKIFTRENILALCKNSFSSVPDWKDLIERELQQGKTLELVWRQGTDLDWVWLDKDIYGQERRWTVLCGLALKQSFRPPVLEIRMADHHPTHFNLKNGTRLYEPPAIEGYVERIRTNSQLRQSLYLSTHDGNLFVVTPNHAYPPSPPGLATSIGDIDAYAESLRKSEINRGAMQIMNAIGVNDLRDILMIRRASRPVPEAMHRETSNSQNFDIWASLQVQPEERTSADDEDEGGEQGLNRAEDKTYLRIRRSFELLLTTGHVVRFEVHSCRVAAEWIERLRALVLYWKQRHRMDAKEEMDLAQSRRPRLTPLTRVIRDREFPPESPPDMGAPMPALGSLYNWCVVEGCKSIIKGGKLFVRKGLWGQYKYVQLFLSAGHLIQFRIKPNSSLHHTMHRKTSLSDAYVCSGYLAAIALPKGQYQANVSPDPRRYQDGLETADPEEEMLFMLWYYPQRPRLEQLNPDEPSTSSKTLPALSEKRKLLVFRTRSRLERDAWCWALNCEIEKLVRAQKDREAQLRDTGNLIPT